MKPELSALEARIIACLIEKEISTPDQYPLSINSLTNACNQKSNREPVMALGEREVQDAVDGLLKRHLLSDRSGYGSRVVKYRHLFCNTEFGTLKFSEQERGIVCELLLRGAQTPGELRAHTARLCRFADAAEVDAALHSLMTRADGPFVLRLERAAGEREARYAHLFSGVPTAPAARVASASSAASPLPSANPGLAQGAPDIAALEARLARVEAAVDELRGLLADARNGADARGGNSPGP